MKKLFISACSILVPVILLAGVSSQKVVVESNYSGVTNSVTTKKLIGYVDSIFIDISGTSTQTVTVASGDTTVLTATDVTADTVYRVRFPAHDSAGSAVAGTTNIQHMLVNETLTVTVVASSTTTNDVGVLVKLDNAK
jgi:N-methylhydantoinase A/oxoprolinase/acetone carboxylase beta subunit